MEDIGAKLYELIQAEFQQLTARDVQLVGLNDRIERGAATTKDISEYSLRLGAHLRAAIEHNVSSEALPNGQMYYNIADKILSPMLKNNYELVNDVAARIQEAVDEKQDIHILPQKAPYPEERVRDVISAAAVPDITEEKMIRRLAAPAETVTASFADDYIKANAEFRSKAGLKSYVIRTEAPGCCKWCTRQAGRYEYPDKVPVDVYKRHDNCKCTVDYYSGRTKQNVWTKKESTISEADRQQMIGLSEASEPTRFTPEEAAQKEREVLAAREKPYTDVTKEYLDKATPGIGDLIIDDGCSNGRYNNEVEFAKWLHYTLGGNIHVYEEKYEYEGQKNPDYSWNGKLWDLKSPKSEISANGLLRKGMRQIIENPGGVMLNYKNNDLSIELLQDVIDERMKWVHDKTIDIMIINKGDIVKILRYKK